MANEINKNANKINEKNEKKVELHHNRGKKKKKQLASILF